MQDHEVSRAISAAGGDERLVCLDAAPTRTWIAAALQGFSCYYLTTLLFLLPFAFWAVRVNEWEDPIRPWSCGADGKLYAGIARDGYERECYCTPGPNRLWNVAFFPAFPLSGRWLAQATGWH